MASKLRGGSLPHDHVLGKGVASFRALPPTGREYRIISSGFSTSPLHDAIDKRDGDRVRELVAEHPEWLERGDALGYTPLHYACMEGVKDLLVDVLAQGAYPFVFAEQAGNTPEMCLRLNGHKDLLPLLPKDRGESRLVREFKVLGHIFALSGSVRFIKHLKLELELCQYLLFSDVISLGLSAYYRGAPSCSLSERVVRCLSDDINLLARPCLNVHFFEELQASEFPFVLPVGWDDHRMILIIWKEYMFVCDPSAFDGMSTVAVFKINPSLVDQAKINEIADFENHADEDKGIAYFYVDLPTELSQDRSPLTQKDRELFEEFKKHAPTEQEADVCTFSSQMIALYVLGSIYRISSGGSLRSIPQIAREIRKLHSYMQAQHLFNFIMRHRSDFSVDFRPAHRAFSIVKRRLPGDFPHLHDVKFSTAVGKVRGDELLQRSLRVLRERSYR